MVGVVTSEDVRITRKVQQLGSSTLAVTLPAEWAREHEVEKGDSVVVQRDESSGSLLVVPDRTLIEDAETTVDASGLDADALRRAVIAQYVLGRRLVHVTDDGPIAPAHRDAVLDAERGLMGAGVVEETGETMTLRCSIAADDFELPTLLGRLDRTETTMRQEALAAFLDGDTDRARTVEQRHAQVDKLFYLLLRVLFATYRNPDLNRAVGVDTGFPLIGYRSVAQDIVLMADTATDLAALTDEPIPEGARERLTNLADAIDDAADAARSAVVEPSYAEVTRAREALELARERTDAANEFLETERPEPLLRLQRAVCALGGDTRHVRDTLDVATRLTFRDGSGATPE